jgi:integrase/recombinase XerD
VVLVAGSRKADRASDEEIVALLRACRSARDRPNVLLMARAGLRRGELCGLRRSDVHLLADSRLLGCAMPRAHLHVVRRDIRTGRGPSPVASGWCRWIFWWCRCSTSTSSSGSRCRGRASRISCWSTCFGNRSAHRCAPDAINEAIAACSRRAGIEHVTPHRLRDAFGSHLADAGSGVDEIATLMGHASMSSPQVYLHPDSARLREAVDRVPSPRELGRDRPVSAAEAVQVATVSGAHVFADTRIDRHTSRYANEQVGLPCRNSSVGPDPSST